MGIIKTILVVAIGLLAVVALLFLAWVVQEAMCKECPYKDECNKHSNDKEFTLPCQNPRSIPTLHQNDHTVW